MFLQSENEKKSSLIKIRFTSMFFFSQLLMIIFFLFFWSSKLYLLFSWFSANHDLCIYYLEIIKRVLYIYPIKEKILK